MNLLFIYTDEQRVDTLAAYGNKQIQTPNLNGLADRSFLFENAYVTQPVCTASRSSILTGLYPHATGCICNGSELSQGIRAFPELLGDCNHATGHIGKWHLGKENMPQHGFQEWISIEDEYFKAESCRSDYQIYLEENGLPADLSRDARSMLAEPYTRAHFVGARACDFIRSHRRDPFILYASFFEPHPPFFGPFNHRHDPSQITLPSNFEAIPGPDSHPKKRMVRETIELNGFAPFGLRTEAEWRRMIANYWGNISLVDTQVGRILQTLSECGLEEDTLVLFTSDHGDMMGSHGIAVKSVPYEEAIRVPLLIRFPGQNNSKRIEDRVSLVDLVPTLLEGMKNPIPDFLHGSSLMQLIQGDRRAAPIFVQWNGPDGRVAEAPKLGYTEEEREAAVSDPVRTIITQDGWKLSISPRGLGHELFHLEADRGERINLIRETKYRGRVNTLLEELRRWQERVSDSVELPNPI